MSVIVARCSKVLRSSFMENGKRCLDSARHDKRRVHDTPNDEDTRCRSSLRIPLKFCVRQTWSKSAEINHEEHEGHKEFATDRVTCRTSTIQATDIGLISVRLLTYIAAAVRLRMSRRRMRRVNVLKTAPVHVLRRSGGWTWSRSALPP